MSGKLAGEVGEREETVSAVEPLLILAMGSLDLAVVSGGIGTNELVTNAQIQGSLLKEGERTLAIVRESVCELKAVVGLDALYPNALAGERRDDLAKEICG